VNETFYKLIPLVLLFAATNAWTEEILSRFVIVAGLHGKLSPDAICWISSIIFGLGHFFGTPNGIFGVIASGILGWLLAKSVFETKSLGWALLIHFLQDVVIFGAGAMTLAGQQ
jgi:membrane protease YdiL (CAAX protease family)